MMDEDLLTRNFFMVNVHGQIESCIFPAHDYDNLYCKCLFRYGPDWAIVNTERSENNNSGKHDKSKDKVFISQIASKRPNDRPPIFVWNLPIEVTFKSSNVFGWPQLIVSVFGIDNLGNDVIRGYGWSHIPTRPGEHQLCIRLFTPQSNTLLNRITNWFVESRRPEFVDSRLAAGNEGRSLVRVENDGEVTILLNVIFKDFKKYGFVSR